MGKPLDWDRSHTGIGTLTNLQEFCFLATFHSLQDKSAQQDNSLVCKVLPIESFQCQHIERVSRALKADGITKSNWLTHTQGPRATITPKLKADPKLTKIPSPLEYFVPNCVSCNDQQPLQQRCTTSSFLNNTVVMSDNDTIWSVPIWSTTNLEERLYIPVSQPPRQSFLPVHSRPQETQDQVHIFTANPPV